MPSRCSLCPASAGADAPLLVPGLLPYQDLDDARGPCPIETRPSLTSGQGFPTSALLTFGQDNPWRWKDCPKHLGGLATSLVSAPSTPVASFTSCDNRSVSLLNPLFVQPLSHVQLCNSLPVYRQAPLAIGFCRQEYWSGLPFPPPGHLPLPGIKPEASALAGGFFTTVPPGKPLRL